MDTRTPQQVRANPISGDFDHENQAIWDGIAWVPLRDAPLQRYSIQQRNFTAGEEMRIGDAVHISSVPVRRRFWEFWKPKVRYEDRTFRVTHSITKSQ